MLNNILNDIFIVYFGSVTNKTCKGIIDSCGTVAVTLLLAWFKIIIGSNSKIECQDSATSDTLECDPVARKKLHVSSSNVSLLSIQKCNVLNC